MQVFQHRKFLVYGLDYARRWWVPHSETDATYAITVLEYEENSLFHLRGVLFKHGNVIDDERKGR
jgi:hypothetical protein